MKHNNAIHQSHYVKEWHERVRTWFDQPAKKVKRRGRRVAKAAAAFPAPVHKLRPIVACPTAKYSGKPRLGRGFALDEIKAAGLSVTFAKQVGICVDFRRNVKSQETLDRNVDRLKAYKAALVLDSKKAPLKLPEDFTQQVKPLAAPAVRVSGPTSEVAWRKIEDAEHKESAYTTVRIARSDARLKGKRAKRAADKAAKRAEAAASKKGKGKK